MTIVSVFHMTRELETLAQLGKAVINQYTEDGVVCPPVLRKGLLTTSAKDSIDHNPSATTEGLFMEKAFASFSVRAQTTKETCESKSVSKRAKGRNFQNYLTHTAASDQPTSQRNVRILHLSRSEICLCRGVDY